MNKTIFQRWLELREQAEREPVTEEDQGPGILTEAVEPIPQDIRMTSNQRFFKWHNDGRIYKTVKP